MFGNRCNVKVNSVTPGTSRWTACAFLEMRPNKKPEVALFRLTLMHLLLMSGPFRLPAQRHMQGAVSISIHKSETRFPLLTHTIENTLHFTFVTSSKMLISSNQATVCCLLITSDCTAHYAPEVNYEQNDGKIGLQSWSSSHQFSTSRAACWFDFLFIASACLFYFSFVHLHSLFTKATGY